MENLKMKEFLNSKAGYILQVLPKHAGDDAESGLIEVPEGANLLWIEDGATWFTTKEMGYRGASILWQRDKPVSKDEKEIDNVKPSRTATQIANASLKHISDRANTYDQPDGERSAFKTALAFNAITGHDLKESEVWLLLQILKDVRQWSRDEYHQDSAEDCIAYASLKAESLENENK